MYLHVSDTCSFVRMPVFSRLLGQDCFIISQNSTHREQHPANVHVYTHIGDVTEGGSILLQWGSIIITTCPSFEEALEHNMKYLTKIPMKLESHVM